MKKARCVLALVLITMLFSVQAQALYQPETNSYTYSTATGEIRALYGPMPYLPEKTIKIPQAEAAIDFCFDEAGRIFVVDNVGSQLILLDQNYNPTIIPGDFYSPSGMFITKDGSIYVADTDNNRITVLNSNYLQVKTLTPPPNDVLGKDYLFKPQKIIVDDSGNIYTVNQNDINGIMQMDADGNFISYIGSNKVAFNPIDVFWKSIMTSTQTGKMVQSVPIQYTNMSMDETGFIYAVSSSSTEKQPIKRLNLSGTDVLERNGYVDVVGDVFEESGNKLLKSSFVDIASQNGVYFALDASGGRIFAYNKEGYLLYAFGGIGDSVGLFRNPCAIEVRDDKVYVLDSSSNSITVFKQTDYSKKISLANNYNDTGRFKESFATWKQVLELNANYELAYAQMGNVYLNKEDYKMAMRYFERGNYRGSNVADIDGYNKAFVEYSKQFAQKYLGVGLCAIAALIFMIGLLVLRRNRKSGK